MKALTVHQPWASLIAAGVKRIETRSWSTKHRGPLAIHAAVRDPRWSEFPMAEYYLASGMAILVGTYWALDNRSLGPDDPKAFAPLPLGAIVATCELVDVVTIVEYAADPQSNHITVGRDGRLRSYEFVSGVLPLTWRKRDPFDVTDQLPFGDFTPGRYAWLLDNVVALDEPNPTKGRQGLWNWEPA